PPANRPGGLLAGAVRCRRPLADAGRRPSCRCRRWLARRQRIRGRCRTRRGAAKAAGAICPHADGKAIYLRAGPGAGRGRRAGYSEDRPRRAGEQLSVFVADRWADEQRSLPNEEFAMIVTKKALSRRTFLRGVGATLALPLLDAMIPSM